ncbi:hypothetical protein pdul_cds_1005 [Pandoravirus dulcis]|uniref:F-box incomplete domain containing protein n=1 Tax=Pandoravirus dulcis TaxID=1349409 RepID=S4VV18_9VIRU|nr:hypothetical protein pdul_cds_1005 [Pandoravirus dulcis]AGO83270.1 hypothetical protein pdul_cds_1005 [Pandoravirus dulcis]
MQCAGTFDALPAEIIALILTDSLPARWRFCARPVCRLWRDVLDAAGDETQNAPRNEYQDRALHFRARDVPWESLGALRRRRRHVVACRWRRGVLVQASAVAEWARTRPDLWDHRPEALVAWCMACQRASRGDVAKALVASGREPLVRYAVGPLFLDRGCLYDDSEQNTNLPRRTRVQDVAEIIWTATPAGLATTALIVGMVGPIAWDKITDLMWFTRGDCPDAFELLLRAWVAHACDNDDALLCDLWIVVARTDSVRIFERLLAIVATTDSARGCDDVRQTEPGGPDLRTTTPGSILATRLATTWNQKAALCFDTAVHYGHISILQAGRASLVGDLACDLVNTAWRRGSVAGLQWCKENLDMPPITLGRLLSAAGQRVDFFEWLFDPQRGGHMPADDAEITDLFHALAYSNAPCALWVAERWPRQSAAVGRDVLAALVRNVCAWCSPIRPQPRERDCHGDLLERLVRVLDLCATHVATGDGHGDPWCNLWTTTVALGRAERNWPWEGWHVILCYAWSRATGSDDNDAVDMLGGRGPRPASQALWARWCRVCPVTLDDLGLTEADGHAIATTASSESPLFFTAEWAHKPCVRRKDALARSKVSALAFAAWLRTRGFLAG